MGSSTWQFSCIAGSDAEIYQFSRVTFVDKFPLHYLEMLKNDCQDKFQFIQGQLESSLRCTLKTGWSPADFHPLIDCKMLYHDGNSRVLENLHMILKEKIMMLMMRRNSQQTFS